MKLNQLAVGEMVKAVELLGVKHANLLDDVDLNGDVSQLNNALANVGYVVDVKTKTIVAI